ncbi:MAG: IPT/TIG domain-containing protein, partial [Thermoanaerobaculia bacterium]
MPVPPAVGVNVSVSASTGSVEVGSTSPVVLVIRATRADNGQPVPNLTHGTITSTLGSFGAVGGPQTLDVELVNGQATVVFFPGDTVGTATIRATVSTGVGFTSVTIREPGVPDTFFLSSVSPATGSPQGGDIVTINGGGFSDPIRVTFDGVPAVIQSASGTQIRVTTPRCGNASCFEAGAISPVAVAVTINLNAEGQASDSLASGFTYVNGGGGGILQPTIFSVTPSSGPNEGGTQVTINGDGFEAPVAVDFGDAGNEVTAQVVSVTRTRLVVLSPSATGIGA